MKKTLSMGLVLLMLAAIPPQAMAVCEEPSDPSASIPSETAEASPSPSPEDSRDTETLPELPLPDSSPFPSPSPSPDSQAQGESASSIFDLLQGSNATKEIDMAAYYLGEMCAAAAEGDTEAGHEAEANRNAIIERNGSGEEEISFDDLYLLSKLIYAEAGSSWLSDDFRLCVGEVVMNRVASPEFPDTIYDVIYQKNQYSSVSDPGFSSLVPSQDCVDVALRLLQGERQMAPSVVFQSNFAQGEIFSIHEDLRLGDTFFCVSNNLDLYP